MTNGSPVRSQRTTALPKAGGGRDGLGRGQPGAGGGAGVRKDPALVPTLLSPCRLLRGLWVLIHCRLRRCCPSSLFQKAAWHLFGSERKEKTLPRRNSGLREI